LVEEFKRTIPVLVPIFDGTRALSSTMKEWIQDNFPSMLDDLIASPEDANKEKLADDPEVKIGCAEWYYLCEEGVSKIMKKKQKEQERKENEQKQKKGDDLLKLEENKEVEEGARSHISPTREELQASSSLFQQMVNNRSSGTPFESNDNEVEAMIDIEEGNQEEEAYTQKGDRQTRKQLFQQLTKSLNVPFSTSLTATSPSSRSSSSSSASPLIPFYLCPIIKKSNHRKHNSHQWFFDAICEGLNEHIVYALLTDCGTSYSTECLTRLFADLYSMPDLIGVTARMRVETPNRFFHPCLDSPFPFLQGI
jgi:hypothetical protein